MGAVSSRSISLELVLLVSLVFGSSNLSSLIIWKTHVLSKNPRTHHCQTMVWKMYSPFLFSSEVNTALSKNPRTQHCQTMVWKMKSPFLFCSEVKTALSKNPRTHHCQTMVARSNCGAGRRWEVMMQKSCKQVF